MQERGALFYIIDAFVAAGIIALTLSIILISDINKPESETTYDTLSAYITFLEETHVSNLPEPTAKSLYLNKTLYNREATLIQAIIELYERGNLTVASSLLGEATRRSLPIQYGVNVSIVEQGSITLLYQRKADRAAAAQSQLVHRKTLSYFQDEQEKTNSTTLIGGLTGDQACMPGTCLYVVSPTPPLYAHGQGCGDVNNGWTAYCRNYVESESLTGIFEVSVWS